jgi:hypothetical protein
MELRSTEARRVDGVRAAGLVWLGAATIRAEVSVVLA